MVIADSDRRSKPIESVQQLRFSADLVVNGPARSGSPRCVAENSSENLMVLAGRPGKEVPMSEQAARQQEALKEVVSPHQPGQAEFRAILAEDIQRKPFAASRRRRAWQF